VIYIKDGTSKWKKHLFNRQILYSKGPFNLGRLHWDSNSSILWRVGQERVVRVTLPTASLSNVLDDLEEERQK
jgi:hypothetical protein